MYELATDNRLFEAESNNGMLHEMLKVLGGWSFPKAYVTSGAYALKHFLHATNPTDGVTLRTSPMTMMKLALNGQSLMARVVRSTSWILLSFGVGQVLRLASNLLLTRLLRRRFRSARAPGG